MTDLPSISFEFFPPKSENGEATFWSTMDRLSTLAPSFVSMTYGAGGTDRERTGRIVSEVRRRTDLVTAAHLTCVGESRDEIDGRARGWLADGIQNIVALRGDPPADHPDWHPHPDGYGNAAELVAGLRRVGDFDISVGAYPECHPASANRAADLDNLKRKLDAGANRALTQFFFDADVFLRFRDDAARAGITAPLVPGILPITNFARTVSFAKLCGASVPDRLADVFEGLDDDPETRQLVAAATACDLVETLRSEGVDAFHFYTLNRPELPYAICRHLGLRAEERVAA